jgi:hypothetical protein
MSHSASTLPSYITTQTQQASQQTHHPAHPALGKLLVLLPQRALLIPRTRRPLFLPHHRILPPHPPPQRALQLRAERQLAQVLAALLRQHEALAGQLLVLQLLQPFFDVFDLLLRRVGGQGGLDCVGDGGRGAVGAETGRGALGGELGGSRHVSWVEDGD